MAILVRRLSAVVPAARTTAASPLALLVLGGVALLIVCGLFQLRDLAPGAPFWARIQLTGAALLGLVATAWSLPAATGRVVRVRAWIMVALGLWLVGELIRDAEFLLGIDPTPSLADLTLVGVLACAGMAYISAAHGRLRAGDEIALYLDGLIVFFATAALLLSAFGEAAALSLPAAIELTYAIFFVSTTGATLLLDLAVKAERRASGAYLLLGGLVLLGLGFLWRVAVPAAPSTGDAGWPAQLLTAGMVVVTVGTLTWNDAEDRDVRYLRLAARLRSALPLAALALTPILLLVHVASGSSGAIGVLNLMAISFVLGSVAVRQSVALRDREAAVSRERALTQELSTAERKYRALVEQQPGVVYVAEPGPEGRWHYVSPQIEEMLGLPAQRWLDDPTLWASRIHPDDRERVLIGEWLPAAMRPGGSTTWEYRLRATDGRDVWVLDDERVAESDDAGKPTLVQGVLLDITERKLVEEALRVSEQQLRHQALHDALTGLANRTLFVDRVEHALQRTRRRTAGRIAVLFLDFDDFKTVNDSLGHAKGDVLLQAVAARLAGAVRADDTAARLGGDEFGILLETDALDAQRAAQRVLDALGEPFEIEGTHISMQASIGIAVSGRHGSTPEELVRNADLAMYLAKRRGKNRYEFYEPGMHERTLRRLELKRRLELAIAEERLELHYQPIVDLEDGSIVGLEALLRWRGRDGQFMPLNEVVTLAEETGLIIPVGRFVLERACRDVRRWQEQFGHESLYAAVNMSVVQLAHGTLLEDAQRSLDSSGLRPGSLVLEITESALADDSDSSLQVMRTLRAQGVRLALDDFGTGYSSLARLSHFPVDIVKVDRSFVSAIGRDREGALVQSVIDLGRRMGLDVIAEGIETRAQLIALRARGAPRGQGYFFSRAVPPEAVPALLSAGRLPRARQRRIERALSA